MERHRLQSLPDGPLRSVLSCGVCLLCRSASWQRLLPRSCGRRGEASLSRRSCPARRGRKAGQRGPLEVEQPLFLLVHHTAQPNSDYSRDDVPRLLRGIFDAHTGSDKGWPDVAYNFFVDRFGRVYEGRTGASPAGPRLGDRWKPGGIAAVLLPRRLPIAAAGCRGVGFNVPALVWLADRDGIDVAPGLTVQFVWIEPWAGGLHGADSNDQWAS